MLFYTKHVALEKKMAKKVLPLYDFLKIYKCWRYEVDANNDQFWPIMTNYGQFDGEILGYKSVYLKIKKIQY